MYSKEEIILDRIVIR